MPKLVQQYYSEQHNLKQIDLIQQNMRKYEYLCKTNNPT